MTTPARPPRLPLLAALQLLALTFLLVGLGGGVTSTDSGMAVPDWPGTNGQFMLFAPFNLWVKNAGMVWEHTHRLAGMAVGLASIAVAAVNFAYAKERPWLRWFGCMILACVVVQGLMGGFRVSENSRLLAAFHGAFGQVTFALMTLNLAAWMPFWSRTAPAASRPGTIGRGLLIGLAALPLPAIGLALLAAALRQGDPESQRQMQWHLERFLPLFFVGLAATLALGILVVAAAVRARKNAPLRAPYAAGSRSIRSHAWMVLGLLLVQLCLGVAVRHWPAEHAVQGLWVMPKMSQAKIDAQVAQADQDAGPARREPELDQRIDSLQQAADRSAADQAELARLLELRRLRNRADRYGSNMVTDAANVSRLPAAKVHTHFTHRILGYLIGLVSIGWLVVLTKRHGIAPVPRWPRVLFGAAITLQIMLGMFTVLSGVHAAYATSHQTMGALLLAATVLLTCQCMLTGRASPANTQA